MRAMILRFSIGLLGLTGVALAADAPARPPTFCNPLDLPYRFMLKGPVMRMAADPSMAVYKNEYWLFPSKSGGYWHSPDMLKWTYVACDTLPVEAWAPTAEVLNGKLLWTTTNAGAIYSTDDPADPSKWTKVATEPTPHDSDLFVAKNGHVYLYSGCSSTHPIIGGELDATTLLPLAEPKKMFGGDRQHHGWEALSPKDYVEGAWMSEHDGLYYLQYASPGTEWREYGDGVYTSKSPLGPWTYASYSPFSYKPTGFVTGTGHSSTFQDLAGEYWHVTCVIMGVRERYERRLALFPAGFTADGQFYSNTYLGDYPQYAAAVPGDHVTGRSPGWMLLSYKKPAEASSTLDSKHAVGFAFDEDMRTWWSAATGDKGEWLKVDLGKPCRIEAAQINFGEQDLTATGMLKDGYGYTIETSADGQAWSPCVDRRAEPWLDTPHAYVQLPAPVTARYVRITNAHVPAGSKFSIMGLRLFGSGLSEAPPAVEGINATRDADARLGQVSWNPVKGADFYIVRYGIAPDRLFTNYQVYDGTTLALNALNVGVSYYVTVDAVNDSGVTPGKQVVRLP